MFPCLTENIAVDVVLIIFRQDATFSTYTNWPVYLAMPSKHQRKLLTKSLKSYFKAMKQVEGEMYILQISKKSTMY